MYNLCTIAIIVPYRLAWGTLSLLIQSFASTPMTSLQPKPPFCLGQLTSYKDMKTSYLTCMLCVIKVSFYSFGQKHYVSSSRQYLVHICVVTCMIEVFSTQKLLVNIKWLEISNGKKIIHFLTMSC